MFVRPERQDDAPAVRAVLLAAFPSSDEADLVDELRVAASPYLALVAEVSGAVVGHVAFSEVTLDPPVRRPDLILGLAPLAVAPSRQNHGIGARLVRDGLAAAADAGASLVVVLGDPAYYGRFGFEPASKFGLRCTFEAPDEAFQALAITEVPPFAPGTVARFRPEFDRFA